MSNLSKLLQRMFFSFVSLTNSQRWASRFMKAADMMPAIFLPRFHNGAGISPEEAQRLYDRVPSLESQAWTNYWLNVGAEFEANKNFRAATMCYALGSFPREDYPWKYAISERRHQAFRKWCEQHNCPFFERVITTPEGRVRYYYYAPANSGRHPVTVFVNGLEGSAEEFAFALKDYLQTGMGFAALSIPGSPDYDRPMSEISDRILSRVLDDLAQMEWVDSTRMGMVGFSFGAYWTMICAKTDKRVRFSVCNGVPYRYTFNPKVGFGLNPVIAYSLLCIFQVRHPFMLLGILKRLIKRGDELLLEPSGPILAMNGDQDTIVDPRDTEIVGKAPGNRLLFFKNDEHCGLFHFRRMVSTIVTWAQMNVRETAPKAK